MKYESEEPRLLWHVLCNVTSFHPNMVIGFANLLYQGPAFCVRTQPDI